MSQQENKEKNSFRITVIVNKDEFENFNEHKEMKNKTGQFLVYTALSKSKLLDKPKKK